MDLWRGADQRETVQLQQKHVRRRIDGARGAINVDRGGFDRCAETLRADHLNDVAGGDVFLRLPHIGQKFLFGNIRLKRDRRNFRQQTDRLIFARLLEQQDNAFDFSDSVFISLCCAGLVVEEGVDEDGDGLQDPVEDQKLIGDEEINRGRAQIVARRSRHNRLHVVDELITDESDGAAGETRQARKRHGLIFFQNALDDFEAVADLVGRVTPCALCFVITGSGGQRTARPTVANEFPLTPSLSPTGGEGGEAGRGGNGEPLYHPPALKHLNTVARLLDDRARVATDERIAAQMFAAFDRLEQKRFALSANFAISGKGRLEIGQQTARDRDEVPLRRQFQKLVPRRKIHSRAN